MLPYSPVSVVYSACDTTKAHDSIAFAHCSRLQWKPSRWETTFPDANHCRPPLAHDSPPPLVVTTKLVTWLMDLGIIGIFYNDFRVFMNFLKVPTNFDNFVLKTQIFLALFNLRFACVSLSVSLAVAMFLTLAVFTHATTFSRFCFSKNVIWRLNTRRTLNTLQKRGETKTLFHCSRPDWWRNTPTTTPQHFATQSNESIITLLDAPRYRSWLPRLTSASRDDQRWWRQKNVFGFFLLLPKSSNSI